MTFRSFALGNVTSQLFANIYLNQLDQFAKRALRAFYYIRYCDDFIILENDCEMLGGIVRKFEAFLTNELKLELHEQKIVTRKLSQGVDFLGYVVLSHYRVLRTRTKRRIFKRLLGNHKEQSLQSYLGVLSHCKGFKIRKKLIGTV